MHAVRRSAVLVAAVVIAAPIGVASGAPGPGKPTTPAAQLLLTQREFPAGYQVEKVPAEQVAALVKDIGAGLRSARISPPHCATAVQRADFGRAGNQPVVAAVNKGRRTAVSEVISSGRVDAATTAAPGCEKVHVEMDRIAGTTGGKLVMDVTTTPQGLAGAPAGSKAALVRSTGTVTVEGESRRIDQEQLLAATSVRGYTVLITGVGTGPGARVDRAGVAQTLTAAADKVRAAK